MHAKDDPTTLLIKGVACVLFCCQTTQWNGIVVVEFVGCNLSNTVQAAAAS